MLSTAVSSAEGTVKHKQISSYISGFRLFTFAVLPKSMLDRLAIAANVKMRILAHAALVGAHQFTTASESGIFAAIGTGRDLDYGLSEQ